MRKTMNVSVAIAAMVMVPAAMGVGWHVDKVDLSEKLADERAANVVLEEQLERQVQGSGDRDAQLAEACGGFWAFEWLDEVEGEPFEAKAEASVSRAQDEVQRGRLACRKSYPKGAEYQGGLR